MKHLFFLTFFLFVSHNLHLEEPYHVFLSNNNYQSKSPRRFTVELGALAMHHAFFSNQQTSDDVRTHTVRIDSKKQHFRIMSKEKLSQQQSIFARQNQHNCDDAETNFNRAQRKYALQNSSVNHLREQSYPLTPFASTLLKDCNIKKWHFSHMFGTQAQLALHQEFAAIIHQTGELYTKIDPSKTLLQPGCKHIAKIADIGTEFNRAGELVHGYCIADWCYTALAGLQEVAYAIGTGIARGTTAFATHAYNHPIETTIGLYAPELILAYHGLPLVWEFLKLSGHVGQLGLKSWWFDDTSVTQEWQELIDPIRQTYRNLYNNGWSLSINKISTTLSFATELATQFVLEHKANSTFLKIFRRAEKALVTAAKSNLNPAEIRQLILPDGNAFHLVEEAHGSIILKRSLKKNKKPRNSITNHCTTNSSGRVIQKLTTKEATQLAQELGFEKTNYYSHGQAVYKKGNLYISPDTDVHSFGIWKMAESVESLQHRPTRMGTYDAMLNRIGD